MVSDKAVKVAAIAQDAIAEIVEPVPPREDWTYSLLDNCGCTDPQFCIFGCCCPCLATPKLNAYRKKGDPNANADGWTIFCSLFTCWFCGDGLMNWERDQIREKTNLIKTECWNGHNAGSPECCACIHDCMATSFCCGCAAVQMKRELAVYYGHAGSDAPVHSGSPAAKKMSR
eukprot:g4323.t1